MRRIVVSVIILSILTAALVTINIVGQEETWVELIVERTRNSKTFQSQADPSRFALDISIASVHYDGPDWKDINNIILPSAQSVPELGIARWEMTQDDYEWFALQDFNTVPMFLFRNRSVPDSYIAFTPQLVQWTNDLNQISSVSVANTGVTGIVDGSTIRFPNGYGTGVDFDISLGPGRMGKALTLQNALPAPPQFILDGMNASLEFVQFFSLPSGPNRPDVVVDGIVWDERARMDTFNAVEFQVAGETVFAFAAGNAFDSSANDTRVQYVLSKSGNNLKVAIRTPYAWLASAVYPVVIDPTLDLQVGAGADDGESRGSGFNSGNAYTGVGDYSGSNMFSFFRFTSVTVPAGATIDAAYMSVISYSNINDGVGMRTNIYLDDIDDAVAPTTNAEHAALARTTEFTAWDDYHFPDTTNFYDSPDFTSTVQEVTDRGGWSSGNAMQILWDDDSSTFDERIWARTYDDASAKAVKLHIEYTSDGVTCEALTVVVNNPSGEMFFNATTDTPTGGLWQEENVSEDFQTGVTPAMNVTNDDGAGACDVTLELLTSPGSGRTMKFSTTSTPPNPGVDSVPVGSNVTVVSSLGSGATQTVWLWIDLDDSQGGQATPTLRVDTELP